MGSRIFSKSKYKNNNHIYGYTKYKDYLTKNYINIDLSNINSKFKSATKEYANKLIRKFKNTNYDIIEIHNRPLILKELIKKVNSKFIMYFHNDPLSMNGSKTHKRKIRNNFKSRKNYFCK